MTLKAKLSEHPDGRVALTSVYHGELVAWLRTLPSSARTWSPEERVWLVSALYVEELLEALTQYGFAVQDARASALVPAEGAALWAPSGMPAELSSAFYQLGLNGEAPLELANHVFRWWSTYLHPDKGGDPEQFNTVNTAIRVIRQYLDDREEAL